MYSVVNMVSIYRKISDALCGYGRIGGGNVRVGLEDNIWLEKED